MVSSIVPGAAGAGVLGADMRFVRPGGATDPRQERAGGRSVVSGRGARRRGRPGFGDQAYRPSVIVGTRLAATSGPTG